MKTLKYNISGLCLAACSLLAQACYEDKGNYDYTDVGSIVIEQPSDVLESKVLQSAMQDELLHVVPVIHFNGVDESNVSYVWDYAVQTVQNPEFTVLSTERELNVTCNLAADKYDLRFKATNNVTGISAYAYYQLTVMSVTTRCVFLLCEVGDNEYDISSSSISVGGSVGEHLYSQRNEGKRIPNATKLVYWNNIHSDQFLWALQSDGGQTLSPFDLTYQGEATDWFFEVPSAIRPTNIYGDVNGDAYFILSDGGIYVVNNEDAPPFKAGIRQPAPDDLDYHVEAACNVANRKARVYAFWDSKNGRFLRWDKNNGCLALFDAVDTSLPENADSFDPNKLQGYVPLFLGDGVDGKSYNLFKGDDGHVHLFLFTGTGNNIVPSEHRVLPDEMQLDKASCIWAHRYTDVIYYAIGNKIYVYEPNVPVNPYHLVYTDEDPNMCFIEMYNYSQYDHNIFAAGNSGNDGYLYNISIEESGDVSLPEDDEDEVITRNGPFERIVDIEYLLKDY